MLQIWSPYANLQSLDLLNESLKLPIPTGEEIKFKTSDKVEDSTELFKKYFRLFAIDPIQETLEDGGKGKEGLLRGVVRGNKSVSFRPLNIEEVKQLQDLKELLETEIIYKPTKESATAFIDKLVEDHVLLQRPTINDEEAVEIIYQGLADFINKHNLYYENFGNNKISRITNNVATYSLYQSVIDPANQLQAQESIDGDVTKNVKNIANSNPEVAEDAAFRTGGNFVNKFEAFKENQEGKDCLAISAVGIKGFFTLTQYFNTILNKGSNYDQELLTRQETKRLLANIRAKDPSTITNDDIVELLVSAKNQDDAAIVLSTLLGLSADNAKELALPKLNASEKMIGMYLYGISIGMSFNDISNLLMSRTALTLKEVMDENVFTGYDGYGKVYNVFNYFDKGAYKLLSKYNKNYISTPSEGSVRIRNPYQVISDWCKGKYSDKTKIQDDILRFIKKSKEDGKSLQEVLDKFDEIYYDDPNGLVLFNQMIRDVKKYTIQLYSINYLDFNKIKNLAKGAKLMSTIGQIAGLNQGLKGDLQSILNKVGLFEQLFEDCPEDIKDQLKAKYGSEYVDISKFITQKKYQNDIIELYSQSKHFVNIPHVIISLPLLKTYVETLAADLEECRRSYKFRSIHDLQNKVLKQYGGNIKNIRQGILNYTNKKLIDSFLLFQNIQLTLPSGSTIYDKKGNPSKKESQADLTIQLGTEWGNASFRNWFEYTVIPEIKKGSLANNKFIRDLTTELKTNTVSGNGTIIYTLPINMLPRTDSEIAIFNSYLDAFNEKEIQGYGYRMIDGTIIPLTKLFTLYAMIAHDWRLGQNSLAPIFEKQQNSGIINDYHKYISDLDKSNLDISQFPEWENEIIPFIAAKTPFSDFNAIYAWGLNPENQLKELMEKESKDSYYDDDYNQDNQDDFNDNQEYVSKPTSINGYKFISSGINVKTYDYFTINKAFTPAISFQQNIKLNNKITPLSIIYDAEQKSISSLSLPINVDNKIVQKSIESVKDIKGLVKLKNGQLSLDVDIVKNIIERELENPCNG